MWSGRLRLRPIIRFRRHDMNGPVNSIKRERIENQKGAGFLGVMAPLSSAAQIEEQ